MRWIGAFCALMLAAAAAAQEEDRQLDADERMFTVLAAINAVGYDDGVGVGSDSLVRQAVRLQLEQWQGESRELLKVAYEQVKQDDPAANLSQFVTYALLCEPPPTFELRANLPTDLPPEVRKLRSLAPLIERFHREAGVNELWEKYQPAFEQRMVEIQEQLAPMMFRTAGYLRLSNQGREFAGFKVWVDLMAAPGSLNTRLYGGEVQVVVHPSETLAIDEIRHAFLMHLLDRLSIRYAETVRTKRDLAAFAEYAPALPAQYKSQFDLLVTKSLAKAVETRLDRLDPAARQALVDEAMSQGYLLTAYFADALEDYEADGRDINDYYQEMVDAIDVDAEGARLQEVKFAEAPEEEEQVAPKRTQLSQADQLLQRAEFLLDQEMLDEAREVFLQVRELSDGRSAQAEYGLARTAILEADPELAREHFIDAAYLADDDPQMRAMSYIYIGRIEDIIGNREEAIVQYKLALEAGAASEYVNKLAQAGIEAPFQRPQMDEDEPEAGQP